MKARRTEALKIQDYNTPIFIVPFIKLFQFGRLFQQYVFILINFNKVSLFMTSFY